MSFKCFQSRHNYFVTFIKHLHYVIIIKLFGVCIYYLECLSRICTTFPRSSFTTLAETLVWLEGRNNKYMKKGYIGKDLTRYNTAETGAMLLKHLICNSQEKRMLSRKDGNETTK